MATVEELRARLRELESVPAGVKQTQVRGQMTTWNKPAEIAAERSRVVAEIRALEGGRKGSTMVSSGGLD